MKQTKKDKRSANQKEVDKLYGMLEKLDPKDPKYQAVLGSIKTLEEINCNKLQAKPKRNYELLKPVIVGMVGLAEILIILGYEEGFGLFPKKALDFILRGRA